jgi:hypothetical protein
VILRALAPVLVATTIGIFATGALLLSAGHKSDTLLFLHQACFTAWAVVFGIHFLAYLPRVARSMRGSWAVERREVVPGAGLRGALVAASIGGGGALALSLLPAIEAWRGGF